MCFGFILPFQSCKFKDWIFVYKSFTYYIIKNEDIYGKLKNDGSMIDYVYGPEPSKIWWRNLWTAPNLNLLTRQLQKIGISVRFLCSNSDYLPNWSDVCRMMDDLLSDFIIVSSTSYSNRRWNPRCFCFEWYFP